MKITYNLHLYYDNGEGYKIIGIREGKDIYDFISKKHDKLLDSDRGSIEISHHEDLKDYIMVDDDYELFWTEKQIYEPEEE